MNMKKFLYLAMAAIALSLASCGNDDDDNNPNPGDNSGATSGATVLRGDVCTQTLTADKKYLLEGQVFVRSGCVLTIQPGTVILGDKRTRGTLVIDKGGKLIARGEVNKPIVFTSNQPAGIRDRGDWSGILMLGNARTNQPVTATSPVIEGITPPVVFGSNNDNANTESSGELLYVRIEFAGIELSPNNETNSLTMGSCGSGTVADYVMTSFGGDDNFEWFGGTNNHKYLVSFATWDDDFDCDYGWTGNVQFGLAIRYPSYADQSGSNGFECDNGPDDNDLQPYTTGTFSNITVLGPIRTGSSISNGNFQHAIDLRRRVSVSIANSLFTGYPRGIRMNQQSVYNQYVGTTPNGVLVNNVLLTPATNNAVLSGSGMTATAANIEAIWTASNTIVKAAMSDSLNAAYGIKSAWFFPSGQLATAYPEDPDFSTSGTGTASFTNAKFSEANRTNFFDKTVTYRGGFGATDWTNGWTTFNPVNKVY